MEIVRKSYPGMTGFDKGEVHEYEIISSAGKMYGHIYVTHTTSFVSDRLLEVKHTRMKKCFGEISMTAKRDARDWCDEWLVLIGKYCTHSDQEFDDGEYGMSIEVSQHGYAYYTIIKFSEKQTLGKDALYPTVSAYRYENIEKKWFGLRSVVHPITKESLERCHNEAIYAWDLITNDRT